MADARTQSRTGGWPKHPGTVGRKHAKYVRVTPEVKERLRRLSKATGVTLTELACRLLTRAMDDDGVPPVDLAREASDHFSGE